MNKYDRHIISIFADALYWIIRLLLILVGDKYHGTEGSDASKVLIDLVLISVNNRLKD